MIAYRAHISVKLLELKILSILIFKKSALLIIAMIFVMNLQGQDRVPVILLMGQSNAMGLAGRNDLHPEEFKRFDNFYILASWTDIPEQYEPGHRQNPWLGNAKGWGEGSEMALPTNKGLGFGLELGFIKTMEKLEQKFYIIKLALPASNIDEHWMPGSLGHNEMKRLIAKLEQHCRAVQEIPDYRMLIWHRGESDAINIERSSTYAAKLEKFIESVRRQTTLSLPVVITTINDGPFDYDSEIRSIHLKLSKSDKGIHYIETSDLEYLPDKLHLSPKGLRKLGQRVAELYLNKLR